MRPGGERRTCPVCAGAVPVDNAFCGACGARMPVTDAAQGADALIGRVIDSRFRILRIIGTGGMGSVYLAEHVGIGKRVAIKVLRADLRAHPELVSRFRREAMAVSKLADPHSITVFDFGMWKGLVYLVMEYLRGADLATILEREGRLDVPRALMVATQVCSSLAEAHEQGVVHRDLKPENIFVTRAAGGDERVKVLDFGLAKLLTADREEGGFQTRDGALLGTPYLMAPEQIRGEAVDGRCDLYSLGALVFRMITGRYPYRDRSSMRILEAHVAGKVPWFAEAAPALPPMPGVEALVRALMQVEAAARPASALAVIEWIQRLQAAEARALATAALAMGATLPLEAPGSLDAPRSLEAPRSFEASLPAGARAAVPDAAKAPPAATGPIPAPEVQSAPGPESTAPGSAPTPVPATPGEALWAQLGAGAPASEPADDVAMPAAEAEVAAVGASSAAAGDAGGLGTKAEASVARAGSGPAITVVLGPAEDVAARLASAAGLHAVTPEPDAGLAAGALPGAVAPEVGAVVPPPAGLLGDDDWVPDAASLPGFEAPTRDEFRAWETGLRRRSALRGVGLVLAILGLAGGVAWYTLRPPPPAPVSEVEPNEEPAQATPLDLGRSMGGRIGPARAADRPDRDVFVLHLPEGGGQVDLEVTGLAGVDLMVEGFDADGARHFRLNEGGVGAGERAAGLRFERRRLYVAVRAVWVQGEPLAENLEDTYTLTVRKAADASGVAPSPATAVAPTTSAADATTAPTAAGPDAGRAP